MDNYYIYVHINPLKNTIFYVGKGKNNRAFSNKGRNIHWQRTVKKYGFIVNIVESNLTNEDACNKEIFYINYIGLKNLTNMTIGGTGGDTMTTHPNKIEIIKKRSISNSGENNGNYGGKLQTIEYMQKQIVSNSKTPIKFINHDDNTEMTFINSHALAEYLQVPHSSVRTAKMMGYKLRRKYTILDV